MKKTFKICVIGAGYVGLSMSACFADLGHTVACFDVDKDKIDKLQKGICPFFDPDFQKYLASSSSENLLFTFDSKQALEGADIIFVAVGTPANHDGSADLSQVYSVLEMLVCHTPRLKVVAIKSTVPVGTCELLQGKYPQIKVVYNPEFLREGMALSDARKPQRIILGGQDPVAMDILKELYGPFADLNIPILEMDLASAEMVKYVANTMLAARVSLMNEVSRLCEKTGADIEQVRQGIGSDSRIGSEFLRAGLGFGGSCLPKDLSALISLGLQVKEETPLLKAIQAVNTSQRERFFEKICRKLDTAPQGKTVAIWGTAFKPGTDDIRAAPSLNIIERLLEKGCLVRVCDPVANAPVEEYFQKSNFISFFSEPLEAAFGSDLLCILTEWDIFSAADLRQLPNLMRKPVVLDGRNILNSKALEALGIDYSSIGR